jgi:DNA-binding transcriptional regulator YiaG
MTVTKLRKIRKERGYTSMESVAAIIGMTTMAVHYWETGHSRPRKAAGVKLEALMQTPLAVLLETETTPEGAAAEVAKPNVPNESAHV